MGKLMFFNDLGKELRPHPASYHQIKIPRADRQEFEVPEGYLLWFKVWDYGLYITWYEKEEKENGKS